MAGTRRVAPESRAGELLDAAERVFASNGVERSTISDITREAGAAKGTFYLYFNSKDDIINGVADRIAERMVEAAAAAVASSRTAVAKFHALQESISATARDRANWELAQIYHRPENRAVHDRMAERMLRHLQPLVEGVIRGGVEEGVFQVADVSRAASFILGGMHALELAMDDRAAVADAMDAVEALALRTLGCVTPTRRRSRTKSREER